MADQEVRMQAADSLVAAFSVLHHVGEVSPGADIPDAIRGKFEAHACGQEVRAGSEISVNL